MKKQAQLDYILEVASSYSSTDIIDAATSEIMLNLDISDTYRIKLYSDIFLSALNLKDGQVIVIRFVQIVGGKNVVFDSNLFVFPNGDIPTLSQDINSVDIITCFCDEGKLHTVISQGFQ